MREAKSLKTICIPSQDAVNHSEKVKFNKKGLGKILFRMCFLNWAIRTSRLLNYREVVILSLLFPNRTPISWTQLHLYYQGLATKMCAEIQCHLSVGSHLKGKEQSFTCISPFCYLDCKCDVLQLQQESWILMRKVCYPKDSAVYPGNPMSIWSH